MCIEDTLNNHRPIVKLGHCNISAPLESIFYRAMHFSAKRGLAIACRLSVRLSVTLVDCDHIISRLVSVGRSFVRSVGLPTI